MAQNLNPTRVEGWANVVVHFSKRRYRRSTYQTLFDRGPRKRVLIFSPDPDLAQSLILLLENRFDVACETKIGNLECRVKDLHPQLVLLDLFACMSDMVNCLEVAKRVHESIPLVLLRGYAKVSADIEREICNLTKWIFYKPINGGLIGEVLETALSDQTAKQESAL